MSARVTVSHKAPARLRRSPCMAHPPVLARAQGGQRYAEPIVKQLRDTVRTRRRLRESARQLTFEDRLLAMLTRTEKRKKKPMADDASCNPDTSMRASAAVTSRTVSAGCCHSRKAAQPLARQRRPCTRVALAEHLPISDATAPTHCARGAAGRKTKTRFFSCFTLRVITFHMQKTRQTTLIRTFQVGSTTSEKR